MSEALLFGPYGDIRAFVHQGVPRGEHRTSTAYQNPEEMDYRADILLRGLLPVSRIIPRVSTQAAPGDVQAYGPKVSVEALKGMHLTARTTGWKFLDALLENENAKKYFVRLEHAFRNLTIQPNPDGTSRLLLAVSHASDVDVLEDAISLVRALTDAADAMIEREAKFDDCAEMLDALRQQQEQVGDEDAVGAILSQAHAATTWMSGQCERIGDDVICRIRLPSDVGRLDGDIRLALLKHPEDVRLKLTADLALPEVDAHAARLDLEEKGLIGWLKRFGEIEVGNSDVDDMFRIFAAPDVAPVLLHAKDTLLALGRAGATIRISAQRLVVAAEDVPRDENVFAHTVESIGILWREVSVWRAGILAGPSDDDRGSRNQ